MALEIPKYILSSDISDCKMLYKWDEWNVKEAYKPADEFVLDRLTPVSHRAIVAMTIACAEWVVFRFKNVYDDLAPLQFLEAAWAANVNLAYCPYFENSDNDWRGPIKGPINIAMTIVIDALFCEDESPNPAENPAWMSNLAIRVLPDSTLFIKWRDHCIQRLERLFTAPERDEDDLFEEKDTGGDFVPREVFDPEFNFKPDMTKELINKFLTTLDYRKNPFLRSPEEMIKLGFKGIPYAI